jgi:hypothetical protein
MSRESPQVRCPTCGKAVVWSPDALWRPFCSERCRLIDLGEWLCEGQRITDTAQHEAGTDPDGQDTG